MDSERLNIRGLIKTSRPCERCIWTEGICQLATSADSAVANLNSDTLINQAEALPNNQFFKKCPQRAAVKICLDRVASQARRELNLKKFDNK